MDLKLIFILGLFALVFLLLIWGKYRYDLIAFGALCVGLLTGLVPKELAFSGFSHEATIYVALVLIISQGLVRSGAVHFLTQLIIRPGRTVAQHIGVMGSVGILLSGFMNNVAALAILMPVDVQAARQAKRSVSRTLMPLSFATLLGGLVTLIGTPPNIIVATARERAFGTPFGMFDFAPVGLTCAMVGLAFIALAGWRLLPRRGQDTPDQLADDDAEGEPHDVNDYITEMMVPEGAAIIGLTGREFKTRLGDAGGFFLNVIRSKQELGKGRYDIEFMAGDALIVEGSPEQLNQMRIDFGLEFIGEKRHKILYGGALSVSEIVVTRESRMVGRASVTVRLLKSQGISVAGISRQGRPLARSLSHIPVQAGDVLLLVGGQSRLNIAIDWLDCLPLARRDINITNRRQALMAIAFFAIAVGLASIGVIPLAAALASVVVLYALTEIVPLRELYRAVAWPVIVLLGSIIPLAAALESAGGTDLIANLLVNLTQSLPLFAIVAILMIVVMIMADIMNTVATAVIAAPIAINVAQRLDINADSLLMAVAIASSCAMLTPIGHKNNTIIMGPGGYRFTDYWRLGLPLQCIIILIAVPMIFMVWPPL